MALFLSVLTGILFGFQSVLVKFALLQQTRLQVLKFLFFTAGILLLPFVWFKIPSVRILSFSVAFLISLSINTVAYLLLFTALKISPISIVMPYIGFTPLFLTLSAFLILGENTGMASLSGILLILMGGFILQIPSAGLKKANKFNIKHFFNRDEKGIFWALTAAFLWSISASVEKIAVNSSSPEFYGASIHLTLGFVFLLLAKITSKEKKAKKNIKNYGMLLCIGIISAALAFTQLTAIKLTQVSTVIAFKRAGILVSGLTGLIFFKEGHWFKTMTGTVLILSGAILISLY